MIKKTIILLMTSLVVLHLLPESMNHVGTTAVFLALLGLFAPSLLERLLHKQAHSVHALSVFLAISGLFLHGMLDGAALSSSAGQAEVLNKNYLLGLAVLLHRLPVGLLIWTLFAKKKTTRLAWIVLAILGLSTVLGYYLGQAYIYKVLNTNQLFQFQALIAGSLLHIAFDQHDEH